MAQIRKKDIRRRQQRKEKLRALKSKLKNAKYKKDKDHLIELIKRREPYFEPSETK